MALPVALQLYSVRDELEADFEGTIAKVKELAMTESNSRDFTAKALSRSRRYLPTQGSLPFRLMFRSTNCSQIHRRSSQPIRR